MCVLCVYVCANELPKLNWIGNTRYFRRDTRDLKNENQRTLFQRNNLFKLIGTRLPCGAHIFHTYAIAAAAGAAANHSTRKMICNIEWKWN